MVPKGMPNKAHAGMEQCGNLGHPVPSSSYGSVLSRSTLFGLGQRKTVEKPTQFGGPPF